MKQYKIFKHPSGNSEAVKQGWSWPAFFFSFIWAMVKKQWALGVSVFIGILVFGFIVGAARETLIYSGQPRWSIAAFATKLGA